MVKGDGRDRGQDQHAADRAGEAERDGSVHPLPIGRNISAAVPSGQRASIALRPAQLTGIADSQSTSLPRLPSLVLVA